MTCDEVDTRLGTTKEELAVLQDKYHQYEESRSYDRAADSALDIAGGLVGEFAGIFSKAVIRQTALSSKDGKAFTDYDLNRYAELSGELKALEAKQLQECQARLAPSQGQ